MHRKDIDGLRGLSVTVIVLFHLCHWLVPGGFVGVDVFFVISGYLVGRQVLADLDSKGFSYELFYVRRVRRILPAVMIMLFAVLVAGFFVYGDVTSEYKSLAHATLAAVASGSNIYQCFFQEQGYFAVESDKKPLTHLWSLGVEEQFYLVWPVLLSFVPSRHRIVFISCVVVGSVGTGQALLAFSLNDSAYYLLPSRMGEMALGTLAILIQQPVIEFTSNAARSILSIFAAVSILLSLGMMSSSTPFPGVAALPSTLGVCILLMFSDTFVSSFLSWEPIGHIGSASYSIYLYHWPIMSFLRVVGIPFDEKLAEAIAVLAITMLLGYVSYAFVETPFRHVKWKSRSIFLAFFVIPAIVLGALCGAILLSESVAPPQKMATARGNSKAFFTDLDRQNPKFYWKKEKKGPPPVGDVTSKKKILVIGDSHSEMV